MQAEVPDAPQVVGIEGGGIEQAQARAVQVGAGGDRPRLDLLAALEGDARTRPVLQDDPCGGGDGADLGAEAPRGGGQGLGERAQPALDEDARARRRCRRWPRPGGGGWRSSPPTTARRTPRGFRGPRPPPAAASVSNHSWAKSATAIGPQRRRPGRPSSRARAGPSRGRAGGGRRARAGSSRSGGVRVSVRARTRRDPLQAGVELRPARARPSRRRWRSRPRSSPDPRRGATRGRPGGERRAAAPARRRRARCQRDPAPRPERCGTVRRCARRWTPGSRDGTPRSRRRRPASPAARRGRS